MRITNPQNLPDAYVRAAVAVSNEYDKGDAEFTVTELNAPPRIPRLKAIYDDEIEIDVASLAYSVLGSAFHTLMQKSERMGLVENRIYMDFEGTRISGKYDLCLLNDKGLLQDWKLAPVYAVTKGAKFEWEAQLNMLDMIATQANDYYISELEVVPMLRDWFKSQARTNKAYPQAQIFRIPVERWPLARKEAYLRERIRVHKAARAITNPAALPECSPEERWTKDEAYAVMKRGNKNAIRNGVFKGSEASDLAHALAATLPTGHYVEHRPGERTRCLDNWCGVAAQCSQWKEELARLSLTPQEEQA